MGVLSGTNASNVTVSGLFFWHLYQFNNGLTYIPGTSTSLTNINSTGSHLNIYGGQDVRISDCWFEGNHQSISLTDSFNIWIDRCNLNGIWDANVPALQDTIAGIFCTGSVAGIGGAATRCANVNITKCNIAGYGTAAATNVTTNGVTVSKTLNAGILYGVRIQTAEHFTISDNYIGG